MTCGQTPNFMSAKSHPVCSCPIRLWLQQYCRTGLHQCHGLQRSMDFVRSIELIQFCVHIFVRLKRFRHSSGIIDV